MVIFLHAVASFKAIYDENAAKELANHRDGISSKDKLIAELQMEKDALKDRLALADIRAQDQVMEVTE